MTRLGSNQRLHGCQDQPGPLAKGPARVPPRVPPRLPLPWNGSLPLLGPWDPYSGRKKDNGERVRRVDKGSRKSVKCFFGGPGVPLGYRHPKIHCSADVLSSGTPMGPCLGLLGDVR